MKTWKRVLSWLLCAALVLGMMSGVSFAADVVTSGCCGGEGNGENLTWTLDSQGVLTISGTGKMADYQCIEESNAGPWYNNLHPITSVCIQSGVTSIGEHAFAYCDSLTSVTIPDSVTSIGYGAFYYCTNLDSVTIPHSVTSIGGWAFAYCDWLDSVTIQGSVTSIDSWTFAYCYCLSSVTIPGSVTSIGKGAFAHCSDLTDFTYGGTEADWKKVTVASSNSYLVKVEKNFAKPPHTHTWDTGTVTLSPTCTETGTKVYACTGCDETVTETLPALGHDLIHHDAQAATCTEAGWEAYDTCSRCEYSTYREIPALGHDYAGGVCTRCGEADPDFIPLSVVNPPAEIIVPDGEEAVITVQAAGKGLTYAWFVKNPGADAFVRSDRTGSEYRIVLSEALDGLQAYCVVTDAYRAAVQTGIVTLRLKPAYTPGDITGDGEIDARDLTALARHVARIVTIADENLLLFADFNGDGSVDAADLTILARYVARIIDTLG